MSKRHFGGIDANNVNSVKSVTSFLNSICLKQRKRFFFPCPGYQPAFFLVVPSTVSRGFFLGSSAAFIRVIRAIRGQREYIHPIRSIRFRFSFSHSSNP